MVVITNGCCTDVSCYGSQNEAPDLSKVEDGRGDSWNLWRNIAKQDSSFGNPLVFCGDEKKSNWMSATVTTLDMEIIPYIKAICKRDPFSGKVTTGGIVTVKDSKDGWYLSWTVNRQPQFHNQPKDQICVWVYGLFSDRPGNYVKKPMKECTGEEVCEEWLYHIGVPQDKIKEFATNMLTPQLATCLTSPLSSCLESLATDLMSYLMAQSTSPLSANLPRLQEILSLQLNTP